MDSEEEREFVFGPQNDLENAWAQLDAIDALDSENDEEFNFVPERRQYKMTERVQVDSFDDVDFIFRFRLSKTTFIRVFQILQPDLEYTHQRCK